MPIYFMLTICMSLCRCRWCGDAI